MSKITYQDKVKFEAIMQDVLNHLTECGYTNFIVNYEMLCDMVETAKRRNKLNNIFLKDECFDESIYQFDCFCEKEQKLIRLNVTPKVENTVKRFFIYEVLHSQYATKQMFDYFKNEN